MEEYQRKEGGMEGAARTNYWKVATGRERKNYLRPPCEHHSRRDDSGFDDYSMILICIRRLSIDYLLCARSGMGSGYVLCTLDAFAGMRQTLFPDSGLLHDYGLGESSK